MRAEETGEVLVVEVTVTGVPVKTIRGFAVPVTYRLADGRTVDTVYGARLKRDVLPGAAALDRQAQDGHVLADFWHGKFVGTVIKIRFGGAA